ncbi:MAG: TIGR03545 family protein, partial [Bdellovibrionales bacterium]
MSQEVKPKKGLNRFVRLEAVLPITIIIALSFTYFKLFFDSHLKAAAEWGLTSALGVEVNIGNIQTRISDLSLKVQKIEITDSQAPQLNVIQIGEIRFSALWDALLRAKIVVNEAAIEQVEFSVPRKSPGYVAPPPPPEELENQGPSAVDKLKDKALNMAENKFDNNVLGDAASWLGDTSKDPLEGIKTDIQSKAIIEKFQKEVEAKKMAWEDRLKNLPTPKEFKELSDRLSKVKSSNFKNPQELASSLKEFEKIIKEADKKYKILESANSDLTKDLKNIESELQSIQKQVDADIKDIESRMKLPKLDAGSLATGIFMSYLAPYQSQFFKYKKVADKYMPPNLKKKGTDQPDESLQPRPRAKGVSYEFGRPKSYPVFWVKKTRISSQAGKSPYSGNIEGEIRHISTNQVLTNQPIELEVKGNFPNAKLEGLQLILSFDNRKAESLIDFNFKLASYPVAGPKDLIKSSDVDVVLNESTGRLILVSSIKGLEKYNFKLENYLTSAKFTVESKQKVVKEIFDNALTSLPEISLTAKAESKFP